MRGGFYEKNDGSYDWSCRYWYGRNCCLYDDG